MPSTRPEFWSAKLGGNKERDQRITEELAAMGWRVLYVWECATRDLQTLQLLGKKIANWIESSAAFGEIEGSLT